MKKIIIDILPVIPIINTLLIIIMYFFAHEVFLDMQKLMVYANQNAVFRYTSIDALTDQKKIQKSIEGLSKRIDSLERELKNEKT